MSDQFTPRLNLTLPDFNVSPWHDKVNNNFRLMDAAIYSILGLAGIKGPYVNSIAVVAGNKYYDQTTSVFYEVVTSHVTSPAPTTFAQDRVINPTYWKVLEVATIAGAVQIVLDAQAAVLADKATVAADKATVAADKGVVAADKGVVAADKATVAADKNSAATSEINAAASAASIVSALVNYTRKTIAETLTALWVAEAGLRIYKADNSAKLLLGSASQLAMFYDGTNGCINSTVGQLRLQTDALRVLSQDASKNLLYANKDGEVGLYFNNVLRFKTLTGGAEVIGDFDATGDIAAATASGSWLATSAEAKAGAVVNKLMTPFLVNEYFVGNVNSRRIAVSGVGTVDISLPTGYTRHCIYLSEWLPNTDNVNLSMRISNDGGATYQTTGYSEHAYWLAGALAGNNHNNATLGSFEIASAVGNLAGGTERGVNGEIVLLNNSLAALHGMTRTFWMRENAVHGSRWANIRHATVGFTHVRLFLSAGLLTSGYYFIESFKE